MTINTITTKLRTYNVKNYSLLFICTLISVTLITSFALMFLSPTVQSVLPTGGDSRKQGWLIFGIAIAGCAVFTTYASSLFFKSKSHEMGTFLALGLQKKKIKTALLQDLSVLTLVSCILGLLVSIPLSFGIWKLFQIFIVDTKEMAYRLSAEGFLLGLAFSVFVSVTIFFSGANFVKRSNIIDLLKENRKNEVVKLAKPYLGTLGWILLVVGLALGYFVPQISISVFGYFPPAIINTLFILALVGVYFIMYHAIVTGKWKKGTKGYYQNIVSINMMRFSGKKTVKNMCVITFILAAATYAAFYTPTTVTGAFYSFNTREYDNNFFYRNDQAATMLTESDISAIAQNHDVAVLNYTQIPSLSLLADGYYRDIVEDLLTEEYRDKLKFKEFISASDYTTLTGQDIQLNAGEYYFIEYMGYNESVWRKKNDVSQITHPITLQETKLAYKGSVKTSALPFGRIEFFILSDIDYQNITKDMPDTLKHRIVAFNTDKANYFFEKDVKEEIVNRSSQGVALLENHDEYEKYLAEQKGETYWTESYPVELSNDSTQLASSWKYYPQFVTLNTQDLVKNIAVFLMLFIYMAIICLVAVTVITYTRGITIGIENKQLFIDLKKLGANAHYIKTCIRKQLSKVFLYPSIVGCLLSYILNFMVMYGNDSKISPYEWTSLTINLGITIFIWIIMYLVYRTTFRRVLAMIGD